MLATCIQRPGHRAPESGLQRSPPAAFSAVTPPLEHGGHSIARLPIRPVPSHHAPIQPAWEYVDLGARHRRYNLKDNNDGTYTHSATGQVYSHQGQTHASGARLLSPHGGAPVQAPQPQIGQVLTHDPKNVLFAIGADGKIEYLANTAQNRLQHAGKYLEQKPTDFALFKNAGKRSGSSKVQDPVTLARYFYDDTAGQFYDWDRIKGGKGKAVSTTAGTGNTPSENQKLLDRLQAGELVDRRRTDRSGTSLLPFDVGPYLSNLTLASQSHPTVNVTYPKLSGIPAWTPVGADVNRDHVPSGESLNQRGDSGAYNQGVTIAIPNPEFHQPFSPTFGTDNSTSKGYKDEYSGNEHRRVFFDRDHPATAAYRDTRFILESTDNQDFSASHPLLDLTKPEHRLRQIGAYRKLNRLNVKLNAQRGSKRGFDPTSSGIGFSQSARVLGKSKKITKRKVGKFTYKDVPGKTSGDVFSEYFTEELQRTKRATLI